MKTEIAINQIIFRLIKKMELKKDPNKAGKQIREYYDELVKQFKEHGYDEITKVIVDHFLNMTIAILDKDEVDWTTGNPALNVVNIYMGIAETTNETSENKPSENETPEQEL
ncbi:MAG: hypothetical protein MUO59_05900 [Actinobacteria bacterium]|nr:hypothetical protein [Actinomycetota bacterium]